MLLRLPLNKRQPPRFAPAARNQRERGAEAHGYRRDPNDPDVLVGPGGRRVWCGALAQLDGRTTGRRTTVNDDD